MKKIKELLHIIMIALIFAVPAALVNLYFSPTLYGQITLYFGPFFIILCLLLRGLLPAILASLLATIGVYYVTDNAFFFVTLSLELIAISWLNRRGFVVLLSDFLYWSLLGGPLSLLYISTVMTLPTDFLLLVYLKLILNGLLYTALAISCQPLLPKSWHQVELSYAAPRLSGRIFYLSFISLAIPSLILALIFSAQSTRKIERNIHQQLQSRATQLSQLTQDFISNYQRSMVQLARSFERIEADHLRAQLMELHYARFPGWSTMLYTDAEGMMQYAYPPSAFAMMQALSEQQRSVSDRDYFQVPRRTGTESYVSPVFMGRGFGENPIIAISAPWYQQARFQGVVEGSLNLAEFSELTSRLESSETDYLYAVTDANHQLIYASEALQLSVLEPYQPTTVGNIYTNSIALTQRHAVDYLFVQANNSFGWNIYILTSPQQMTAAFAKNMGVLVVSLVLISLLFTLVARRFSRQITQPLEALSDQMLHDLDSFVEPSDPAMSEEVRLIAQQLSQARNLMVEFNHQLKQQVSQKTVELERLNRRLELLAQTDGLTGLLNRRAFDEQAQKIFKACARNHDRVSFILLDLDHFKQINDTRGHPVGDECLIAVARLLQQIFRRENDLVARYGGEEFAIFISSSETDVMQQIELLRQGLTHCCVIADETIPMTASFGCVVISHEQRYSYTQLVQLADQLLYRSKRQGRDQLSVEHV